MNRHRVPFAGARSRNTSRVQRISNLSQWLCDAASAERLVAFAVTEAIAA
jgi:hypothetical protein